MKSFIALSIACCVLIALLGGVTVSGSPVGDAEFDYEDLADNSSTPASPTPGESTPDMTTTPEMTTSEGPESTTPESSGSTPEVISTSEQPSTPHGSGSTPRTSPTGPSTSGPPVPPTPAPSQGFDVGSFFGGIATGLGVIIVAFVGYKLYSRRGSASYNAM